MRYQYTSSGFKQGFTRPPVSMPRGIRLLIFINIVVFLLTAISGEKGLLFRLFGLVPLLVWKEFKFWQLFTYLFVHGGFFHIFFNMLMLWVCGQDIENRWGRRNFFLFYFICGIGAGVVTMFFNIYSITPIVGASGAIYGLLVAYGFTYPNRILLLYSFIPIKAKYLVLGFGSVAFIAFLSSNQSNISHITHLSGMIIGLFVIFINMKRNNFKIWYLRFRLKHLTSESINKNEDLEQTKERVDEILDKLNDSGWNSLSDLEEKYLIKASNKLFKDVPPN